VGPRRVSLLLCLLAVAAPLVLGACGEEHPGVHEPAREGLALELDGVDYNVFITRQLNPEIQPDVAYYSGDPAPKGMLLYGVFLQTCNATGEAHQSASEFEVHDNQGNVFEPVELEPGNQFAYEPKMIADKECDPAPGSVAQLGPTDASLLLFEIPVEQAENRPLELEIANPEGGEPEHISFELDL
jgi:hypothetical protein